MRPAGKKAREVDLADFNLDQLEALDPSHTFGEQKVAQKPRLGLGTNHRKYLRKN